MREYEEQETLEVRSCHALVYPDAMMVEVVVALATNTTMLGSSKFGNFARGAIVVFYIEYAVIGELLISATRHF